MSPHNESASPDQLVAGQTADTIEITRFPSIRPHGYRVETTREAWFDELSKPLELNANLVTKEEIDRAKKHLALWSPATFRDNYKSLESFEKAYALGFDVDQAGADFDRVATAMSTYAGVLHTTTSHSPEKPALRLIVWLSRSVLIGEYDQLHRWASEQIPGVARNVRDASRFWYMPALRSGHEFRCVSLPGELLDVGAILATLPHPQTVTNAVAVTELAAIPDPTVSPAERVGRSSAASVAGRLSPRHRAERFLAARGAWDCPHGMVCRGQRCHSTLFKICVDIVRGFALLDDDAFEVIWAWNMSNKPPYPDEYILEQIARARAVGQLDFGHHLRAPMRRAG